MNYHGIILGLGTFLCIGLFHPLVIKAEYHFGVAWRVQLLVLLVDPGAFPTKKKSGKRLVSEEREEGEKVKK